MNSKLRHEIIKLNNDFYKKTAAEFSATRQYPWKGWFKLIPILHSLPAQAGSIQHPKSILDLGCGNGRFASFLIEHMTSHTFEYIGIDSSEILLNFAKLKIKNLKFKVNFKETDIFDIVSLPKDKFDIVVGFGITHHIPGSEFRKEWFKAVSKIINKDGLLILSFWKPDESKLLSEKLDGFEEGDYLMGWDKTEAKRYVHIYSNEELTEIMTILQIKGLKLIEIYIDDKKGKSYNEYLVFQNNC